MLPDAYVVLLVVELHLPEANSLKAKRSGVQSVKAQLQGRLGAAVSEVDHHELWQRSTLLAALTGGSLAGLDERADAVERWLQGRFPETVSVRRIVASLEDLAG